MIELLLSVYKYQHQHPRLRVFLALCNEGLGGEGLIYCFMLCVHY